ncbi:hypothetical protein ACFL0M_14915 [Thermodesulfobacteriota bacterium]
MKILIKTKKNAIRINILFFFAMTTFVGCLANYGTYRASDEVNKAFEAFQVLPDYTYYYSGSDVSPDAIIGIHKRYKLSSADLWTKVDPTSKQLKYWVEAMTMENHRGFPESPDGFYVLDPDGNQIGIYYTLWAPGPVKMEEDNQVSVYLPDVVDDNDGDESEKIALP